LPENPASPTERQLRLALKSNARLRLELAQIRDQYRRRLNTHRVRISEEHARAELWKHRALRP